ncbi:WYL domain-containing protein [Erysipelothrix rhusiopathiae]|uniref:HTH domain protein n=1 Tax=Erysipelothrix rhusiopathiae ATCC 19414 TaxID=525280 RepID=E7FUE4_ERYRH|nr:WYL domain-containing protein [Erysipelothrix rhusiopathiae]AMS11571.1 transcriptional regulator [Erysipelothrix rhusiopathiae]AOO68070.1 transcriptional regulator [Erysipelothrix rhusiopathiae]AWU41082.1 WYL domain-containing transcriptional regulator [Erysipelothrix rhusiopathiae]EFY09212.1 HTH domain protein [Erysipelothrix rhusiopathiae ATCC 19414]MCG4436678.1 WYL domain-containing transcriptional regulator [Erysipelothrix rhusiopathiae]
MSKLSNALVMLDVLSARSVVPLSELADLLEISERGVQRLKGELESVGYEITTVMGPGGGYVLESKTQLQPLAFERNERKMLKQAFAVLLSQDNPTLGNDFVAVISKLSHQLDYSGNVSISAFQSVKLNVDPNLYQKHIEMLENAIENHLRIDIVYNKNHREKRSYIFEPYELVIVNKFWYLLGYDEKNRYLSLKVNRIHELSLRDEIFRFDDETSSKHVFSKFGYKIKPVFAELEVFEQDYISEYIWGEHQEITWIDDHRFVLKVEFSNELAVKDFILQGGSHITVLKPEWLREWIVDECHKITKLYR